MPSENCPSADQLKAYMLGELQLEQIDLVAQHVEDCPSCEDIVAVLEQKSDTVLSSLRDKRRSKYASDNDYRRALSFVKQIGREGSLAMPGTHGADEDTAPPIGSLREYELLEKLGAGGMGAVYKARHTKLDKIVAIKVLPPERMKDASAVARFEREMRAVGKLEHPNIVRAMDAREVDGMHFLVMEYVNGADLSQLVTYHGPLPIAEACELTRQAAIGLDEAFDHDMVHRDIKPSNLILAQRRRQPPVVKILDLGLALLSEAQSPNSAGLTSTGQMMGTIDYMAPEQGGDSRNVDIRADIYALGATLYKLLTGKTIYHGEQYETVIQKMMALASEPAPSIQKWRPDVPDELAAIVHRMIEKDPAARFATPAEVAAALAPFASGADLGALAEQCTAPTTDAPKSLAGTEVGISRSDVDTEPTVKKAPEVSVSGGSAESSSAASAEIESLSAEETQLHGPQSPKVRPATGPWTNTSATRRRAVIGSTIAGFIFIVLGFVLLLRTPEGTLRIEVTDEDLEVLVDGEQIKLTDKKWKGSKKARRHRLAIKLGDQTLNIGSPTVFQVDGGEVEHHLTVGLSGVSLASNEFEVVRGEETVLKISLERQKARLKPAVAPDANTSDTALKLNGRDSSIEVPRFQYDGSYPVTVEAVVTIDGMPHNTPHLVDTTYEGATRGFVLYINGEYERRRWRFSVRDQKDWNGVSSAEFVVLHQPVHVAGVYDGQEVRLFVDGKLTDRQTVTPPLLPIDRRLMIGAPSNPAKPGVFAGCIHVVRISQTARYTNDFQPPPALAVDDHTMAFYLPDAAEGDNLPDLSRSGSDGRMQNVAVMEPPAPPVRMEPELTLVHQRTIADYGSGDLAISPDQTMMATGGDAVRLWALPEVRLIETMGDDKDIQVQRFSPDSEKLVNLCYGENPRLQVLNVSEKTLVFDQPTGGLTLRSADFAPDGNRIYAGSNEGVLIVADGATGKFLKQRDYSMKWLRLSPDGSLLATAEPSETIRLWDRDTLRPLRTLRGHCNTVGQAMLFTADGSTLLTGSYDRRICKWDVARGKLLDVLRGSTDAIRSLGFCEGGRTVVAGCRDGYVRFWDLESGGQRGAVRTHEGRHGKAVVYANGTRLATIGADGSIKLWEICSVAEARRRRKPLPGPAGPPGKANRVLSLDWDKSFMRLAGLRHETDSPLTVEAWLKPHDLPRGREWIVANLTREGVGLGISGRGFWRWYLSGVGVTADSAETAARGEWSHVAGVLDTNAIRLYVNGRLQQEMARQGTYRPSSAEFLLGSDPDPRQPQMPAAESQFHGEIDELRISSTVRYHQDFLPQRRFEADAETQALYHFDGQEGLAIDASGNAHHGFLSNAERKVVE